MTWRILEYVAGMRRRVDEYETPEGEDPLGYDTSQPPDVYLRQMAEDALAGRHARPSSRRWRGCAGPQICRRPRSRARNGCDNGFEIAWVDRISSISSGATALGDLSTRRLS
jgi:hypothetical protein